MKGKNKFTSAEITLLKNLIKKRVDSKSKSEKKEIRDKMRKIGFYGGADWGIKNLQISDLQNLIKTKRIIITDKNSETQIKEKIVDDVLSTQITSKESSNSNKDEHYVLDICDKVLEQTSSRQHRFDFLVGGSGTKLPVDSYYEELKLVIEYREKQHTEKVTFFDKPDKLTVSGVHRGEQRKIYDERRREVLPKNKITLIEISYSDFDYGKNKKIIRDYDNDEKVIKTKLAKFISKK